MQHPTDHDHDQTRPDQDQDQVQPSEGPLHYLKHVLQMSHA